MVVIVSVIIVTMYSLLWLLLILLTYFQIMNNDYYCSEDVSLITMSDLLRVPVGERDQVAVKEGGGRDGEVGGGVRGHGGGGGGGGDQPRGPAGLRCKLHPSGPQVLHRGRP